MLLFILETDKMNGALETLEKVWQRFGLPDLSMGRWQRLIKVIYSEMPFNLQRKF